jgi:hypothetical protein
MKYSILFVICWLGCAKLDIQEVQSISKIDCNSSTLATVKKQNLNVAGTEYFYFLEVEGNIKNSNQVFAGILLDAFQKEGQKLIIRYHVTDEKYIYIPCTEAHPTGIKEESMPLIKLCSADPIL